MNKVSDEGFGKAVKSRIAQILESNWVESDESKSEIKIFIGDVSRGAGKMISVPKRDGREHIAMWLAKSITAYPRMLMLLEEISFELRRASTNIPRLAKLLEEADSMVAQVKGGEL